ncbi:hypothetical protein V495_04552, partial [Pseudogymnoascus sp. VKM F-4514 (FW-929)]
SRSPSPVPAPTTKPREDVPRVSPPFRGSTGTPLCTIPEDKKLKTSARNWLLGRSSRRSCEKLAEGRGEDVKVATKSEPPREPSGNPRTMGRPIETRHELPPAGVGEREVDGEMHVSPEIEEAMRKPRLPSSWKLPERRNAERRVSEPAVERGEREERERTEGREEGESVERVESVEREQGWWRGARRRVSRLRRGGSGGSSPESAPESAPKAAPEASTGGPPGDPPGTPGAPPPEADLDLPDPPDLWELLPEEADLDLPDPPDLWELLPEEANEYMPSMAAPPEMLAAAAARVGKKPAIMPMSHASQKAAQKRALEREARTEALREAHRKVQREVQKETQREAEKKARKDAEKEAQKEAQKKLTPAERAKSAVENEPHSPGWNGSTYIDGREHHYCGPDFPCQMEPVCSPSIRDLWDKGYPITPTETSSRRISFMGPVRALFGMKKPPPEPQYYKPAQTIQSIRVGNTADTTIIRECPASIPSEISGEEKKDERTATRRFRKLFGFGTSSGGKKRSSSGVAVASSQESIMAAESIKSTEGDDAAESVAASVAARNLAASQSFPVGESNVATAKTNEKVDSNVWTTKNNGEGKENEGGINNEKTTTK